MNNIRIARKISARSEGEALKIIKTKYPRAKIITYKFLIDFRLNRGDYNTRLMNVVFIDDVEYLRGLI